MLINFISISGVISVCVRCLKILTPRSVDSCIGKCQQKPRFIEGHCQLHNIPKVLGAGCIYCNTILYIKTINPDIVLQVPTPAHTDTIFHSENGQIFTDILNILKSNDNIEYRNIIDGSATMIGGGDNIVQYGPVNIIKKVEDTLSEVRLYITPPQHRIFVEPYLHDCKDSIYSQIKTRNLLKHHTSYKAYITCFSKYYKLNSRNEVQFGGMHHRTPIDLILAHSGALNQPYLEYIISNIGNIQLQQQNNMQGSNWIYLGTAQIVIVFIKLLGKPVGISDYIPYQHARGRHSIINIDNTKPENHKTNISPCVVVGLRVHQLLTDSNNTNRDADLKYLTSKFNGKIKRQYWHKLRKYNVTLPMASIITGEFNFEHWSDLERANKIPITVHFLKPGAKGRFNIECLRTPSQKTMLEYKPAVICHLLMLNSSHVCYIPNMSDFMKSAFHSKCENRCMFCYTVYASEITLTNHLNDGMCYNNKKQPTKIIFDRNQSIPHQNLITEMCPELMFFGDCEAYLSKDDDNSDSQNSSDSDEDLDSFDNMPDNNIQREKTPGKIASHIPHSISIMSLNHKFEMQQYQNIWGLDCAHRLLDVISEMITDFHEKVKHLRYPNPVLTIQDNFNFMNATHCAYCNIDYTTIPKSMIHKHHDHHKKPVYGTPVKLACGKMHYPVISGNYVASSCAYCNWQITNKRRIVNVYFHNLSMYDGPLLISGLLQSKLEDFKSFKILPKGASAYHYIQYRNIRFLDSLSFMPGSLSSLVNLLLKKTDTSISDKTYALQKVIPTTVKAIRESHFNNDVIPLLTGKLSYPYCLPKKLQDFENINYFPSQDSFRDELNGIDITPTDYAHAKLIFEKSGCRNLRDLCDLYILCDVAMLADVFSDFNKEIYDAFSIHVANFVTGPSLSM